MPTMAAHLQMTCFSRDMAARIFDKNRGRGKSVQPRTRRSFVISPDDEKRASSVLSTLAEADQGVLRPSEAARRAATAYYSAYGSKCVGLMRKHVVPLMADVEFSGVLASPSSVLQRD